MKRDPLDQLRLIDEPVAPRPEFADELEARMRRALDVLLVPTTMGGGPMMTGVIEPALTASVPYDDMGTAVRWLTQVLGLRIARMWGPEDNPIFVYLSWRDQILSISVRPSSDNPWAAVGPASFSLLADEETIRATWDRAVAAGAEVLRPLGVHSNPAVPDGYVGFVLRDPEGNMWSMHSRGPTFELVDGEPN